MDRENQETKLENLKVEESKIQDKFKSAVENNKFYDFLKKVFKKKFKPPKVKTDGTKISIIKKSNVYLYKMWNFRRKFFIFIIKFRRL